MQGFLFSVVAVVVISLIFEIVFPAKRLKGVVTLIFGLVIVLMLTNGVKSVFSSNGNKNLNLSSFSLDGSELFYNSAIETEKQLKNALEKKGFEVTNVKLDYEVNELSIKYISAKIETTDTSKTEEIKSAVQEILDIKKENIWVQN